MWESPSPTKRASPSRRCAGGRCRSATKGTRCSPTAATSSALPCLRRRNELSRVSLYASAHARLPLPGVPNKPLSRAQAGSLNGHARECLRPHTPRVSVTASFLGRLFHGSEGKRSGARRVDRVGRDLEGARQGVLEAR